MRVCVRARLSVASGGVVFTTIHKFMPDEKGARMPLLTDRSNVVVIADEAHRSQYDLIDGFARHLRDALPNAAFIGFTGTPIETTDANTRAIFGEYISVYDIQRAVADKATVPIYYESRIAKLRLNEHVMETIDDEFEELTEAEEVDHKEELKTKWSALEAMVGDPDRLDAAIRQLVDKAIIADDGVIDVFTAAGIQKPDISILSDEFLAEVRGLKHRNVAVELLEKLLTDEIRTRYKSNIVESKRLSDLLQQTLNRYHNRAIETQEVIEELIRIAKDLREAISRGEMLGLNDDELAFYDALADNSSARIVMGDDKLKLIATELVKKVRESVTIDWNLREQARAKIRVIIKRILREHGYPPDLQTAAAQLVLQQAELLCEGWV